MDANKLIDELSRDLMGIARYSSALIYQAESNKQTANLNIKYIYASSLNSIQKIIKYKKELNNNDKTD